MSKDLVIKKDIAKEHELSVIERVVMQGDLSKLDPTQRVTYYNKVCESMGLNPYTRPFDYISLNGKLTLYAKKDATEQLRQVKKISIVSLEGRMVDDLYIVVAKATTPDGRLDQSTGAVSIGNLKGEQKANAIMKAETKAKRRVTLSISGMGWTDESEIESIPHAKHVNVDLETGEVIDIPNPQIGHTPQPQVEPPAPPVAPPPPPEPPKDEKHSQYNVFCHKHSIMMNSDGTESKKLEFVRKSALKAKMSEIRVINFAINNEADFQKKFDKWSAENYPNQGTETPRSMDELV
jgi:hypothetical protein